MKYVSIGDLHGSLEQYKEIKRYWGRYLNNEEFKYIIVGDIIDRGLHSKQLIEEIMNDPNVIMIRGNHEQMMIDCLREGADIQACYIWLINGGIQTLLSFGVEPQQIDQWISNANYEMVLEVTQHVVSDEIKTWLKNLPLFFSLDKHFFVHAGVKPGVKESDQHPHNLLWIRNEFLHYPGKFLEDKIVIHGHTPTDISNVQHNNRINLDAGLVFGGKVVSCLIDENAARPLMMIATDNGFNHQPIQING